MTTIAHISDVHLPFHEKVTVPQLLNKRITGYLNWKLNRGHIIENTALSALMTHLKTQHYDHMVITGDLINLSLEQEFALGQQWLKTAESAKRLMFIPGNHDIYVPSGKSYMMHYWHEYMAGERADERYPFPFWRQVDDVALIGCNSAIATPPFFANGTFSRRQERLLEKLLIKTKEMGLFRIVMIHHPPHNDVMQVWRRGLTNRHRFQRVIQKHGAELILHGHLHRSEIKSLPGPEAPIPLIGIASASMGPFAGPPPARYNLYEIEKQNGKFSCTLHEYGYHRFGDKIEKRSELVLT